MNSKFKLGIVLLGLGCGGFTWLMMYMSSYYPAAFFGLMSKHGYTFNLASAPAWLWGTIVVSLLCVVKGATSIGRGIRERGDD